MKNINYSIISVAAVMVMAASFSACRKDDIPEAMNSSDNSLRFKIETIDIPGTRSAAGDRLETIDLSEEDIPLFVTASVAVNTGAPVDPVTETRGAIIDKNSMLESGKKKGIPMWMITSNGSKTDAKEGRLKKNDSGTTEDYWSLYDKDLKTKIDWVEASEIAGAKASFLSYFDYDSTTVITGVNYSNVSLDYKSKASKFTLGVDGNDKAKDSQGMNDLLFAYAEGIDHQAVHGTTQDPATVTLKYFHPLAAVRFVAPVATDRDQTISISRVTINNVITKGTATYNKSTDISKNDAFKTAFSWTLSSNSSDRDDFAQVFSSDKDAMTFFVAPQALNDIVVTFNVVKDMGNGIKHERQLSAPMSKLGVSSWDQGYIYTYTLDTKALGKVSIDISEVFSADKTVKTDVKIENKVQSTSFVRAKIAAYWCTDGGKILGTYTLTDTNISINTTNWLKGKDGFYYCNLPVRGYSFSPVLINRFEMPSDLSSLSYPNKDQYDIHLEMRILAQAVESDTFDPGNGGTSYIVDYWGDSNGKILLENGEDLISKLKF